MYKFLLCLFMVVSFSTCSKIMCGCEPPPPPSFKVTVLETSEGYCNKPLLLFEDSAGICEYTGLSRARYVVNQLADSLKIPGKKLYVYVGILQPNEEFACSGTGTSYHHLKLYQATSAN